MTALFSEGFDAGAANQMTILNIVFPEEAHCAREMSLLSMT